MEISRSRQLTNPIIKKTDGNLLLLFSKETGNVPCGAFHSLEEVSEYLYGNQLELFDLKDITLIEEDTGKNDG